MLNIAKFRVLPESQLSEQDFDDYPVWSEYYDWEEIEDLERWGLNREKVLHLFEKTHLGMNTVFIRYLSTTRSQIV